MTSTTKSQLLVASCPPAMSAQCHARCEWQTLLVSQCSKDHNRCPPICMHSCLCYRRSRVLEHCQQMLREATAGLEGYCPVCLLPCAPTRHAPCHDPALLAPNRAKAVLQHTRHGQEGDHTGEHSLRHGNEQQQPPHSFKAAHSLGTQRSCQTATAGMAADTAALSSQQQAGGCEAREDAAAPTADAQQQQQPRGAPNGDAEASKEMTEAWVTH